ncbi:MAG: class I SAM-dependent methyltransferase [Fimbriimonadaceae bacterium]|nr:class I SAM-dependent methyltransferase [Fimbriimonadaceae bacterium]QYK58528.1 MAG: class I SAM-dependent methyltransferase [Fimbriimonadaceae bacterium]
MSRPGPGDPAFSEYWKEFHDAVEPRPYNPFLDVLEPYLPSPGLALDVGSGRGKSTVWLLDRGFDVWAQDADPVAMAGLVERVKVHGVEPGRLTTSTVPFEEAEFPACTLAVSVFSLFFTHPGAFDRVWAKLRRALEPGAVFGGQLLGPNDDWASPELSFHSSSEAHALFNGLEILHWEEVERDGQTALGQSKHWHVFHIVARRPL